MTFSYARGFTRGQKLKGPLEVVVRDLNVLRYDVQLGVEVSYLPGPDLSLAFIPLPRGTISVDPGVGRAIAPLGEKKVPTPLQVLWGELTSVDNSSLALREQIGQRVHEVNRAIAECENLVVHAEDLLRIGRPDSVLSNIEIVEPSLRRLADAGWPVQRFEEVRIKAEQLKTQLVGYAIEITEPKQEQIRLLLVTRVVEIIGRIETLSPGSQTASDLAAALKKLRAWGDILRGIAAGGTASFQRRVTVTGSTHFLFNTESKVELSRRDRLAKPETAPEKETVITVVSPSPLSVSAGFGVSWSKEEEFVSVPTLTDTGGPSPITVPKVGLSRESRRRPIPAVLINVRGPRSLEFSVGAATDKAAGGGVEFEYLVGAGFSLQRSIVITGAVHVARETRLAGGFAPGSIIPSGTSTVPSRKIWKGAPALMVTFRMR